MKKIRAALPLLTCFCFMGVSRLEAGNGTVSAQFLQENPSARQVAMGGVHTVNADAADAIHSNPAGLGIATRPEFTLSYNSQQDNAGHGFAGFAMPALSRERFTLGIGAGILYYTGGNIDVHFSNGSPSQTLNAERAYAGILALGSRIGRWLSIGIAPKFIKSTLVEQYSSNATAIDGGVIVHPFPALLQQRLSLGGTFQNYGSKLSYRTEQQSLPETTALGAGYRLFSHRDFGSMSLSAQMEKSLGEEARYRMGGEYGFGASQSNWQFFLRGGYRFRFESEDYSIGLGVRESYIEMNYAFVNVSGLDRTHRLSLSFRFGKYSDPKHMDSLEKESDDLLRRSRHELIDEENTGKKEEKNTLIDQENRKKKSKPLLKDETKEQKFELYKESETQTGYELMKEEGE